MKHFFRSLTPKFRQRLCIGTSSKKPKFHLEDLPFELIVEVLRCSRNFADLRALITTSPICHQLFKRHQNSVLTQVARNVIGPDEDTWRAATAVLVYQRKANSNSTKYLPDFVSMGYVLQREDIGHLISDIKFYKAVAKKFAKYVKTHSPLAKDPKGMDPPLSAGFSTFAPGDALSMKAFFQHWLLSLQFGYDSIWTFAKRKPLTKRELMDARVIIIVTRRTSGFKKSLFKALWSRKHNWLDELAAKRISMHRNWCWPFSKCNYILWAKIMFHYDYLIWKDSWNGIRLYQYDALMLGFCSDLGAMELGALIEKYKLSCGWD